MGLYLGVIFQIADDINDIVQDIYNTNIVKIQGKEKSLQIYYENKTNLLII